MASGSFIGVRRFDAVQFFRVAVAFDSAAEVAGRIRAAVAGTPLSSDGRSMTTSVSIGVANYPDHGRSIDAVLARADRAMYLAKQNGRDGVVKFEL